MAYNLPPIQHWAPPKGHHYNNENDTFALQRIKSAPQSGFVAGNLPESMYNKLEALPKCHSEIGITSEMVSTNQHQAQGLNGGCVQHHAVSKQKSIAWEIASPLPAGKQQLVPLGLHRTISQDPMLPTAGLSARLPILQCSALESTALLASCPSYLPPLAMKTPLVEDSTNTSAPKAIMQAYTEARDSTRDMYVPKAASDTGQQSRNAAQNWETGSNTSTLYVPGQYVRHKPNSEYLKLRVPQRQHKRTTTTSSQALSTSRSTKETAGKISCSSQVHASTSRCSTSVSANHSSGRYNKASYAMKYMTRKHSQSSCFPGITTNPGLAEDTRKVSRNKTHLQVNNLKEIVCMSRIPQPTRASSRVAMPIKGVSKIPGPPQALKECNQELPSENIPECPLYSANAHESSSGACTPQMKWALTLMPVSVEFWVMQ